MFMTSLTLVKSFQSDLNLPLRDLDVIASCVDMVL